MNGKIDPRQILEDEERDLQRFEAGIPDPKNPFPILFVAGTATATLILHYIKGLSFYPVSLSLSLSSLGLLALNALIVFSCLFCGVITAGIYLLIYFFLQHKTYGSTKECNRWTILISTGLAAVILTFSRYF